ncbi:hypothetical protein F2Q69_00012012 [Brassica cretica]|uniref:Uncharacterized protein n=1 Tax=Brassica cretica TaxID=69181 RepID=A0A8S9R2L5_BRACR|nr:hypothetical protein F2Q69_00012012 [Brassica cretica]
MIGTSSNEGELMEVDILLLDEKNNIDCKLSDSLSSFASKILRSLLKSQLLQYLLSSLGSMTTDSHTAITNSTTCFLDVLRFAGVINSTFSDHEQSVRPIMVDLQVDRLSGDEQSNEIDGPQTRHPHPVAAQHNCCNGRGGNYYLGDDIPGVHVSPANALMDKVKRDVSQSYGNLVEGSGRFVPNRNVIYLREKLITFLALISTQWKESSPNLRNQTGDGPLTRRRNG